MATNAMRDNGEKITAAVDTLINMFSSQQFAGQVAKTILRRKAGDVRPCDKWTIGNNILMLAQGTDDARGFKQWQEVGRHVKKGGKAIHIVAPCTGTRTQTNAETGEEVKITFIKGFRLQPVFAVEITEGEPLPYMTYTLEDLGIDALPPLADVCRRLGITVDFRPTAEAGCYGYCKPEEKKIVVGVTGEAVESTLAHELAHCLSKPETLKDNDFAEVVAEVSSAVYMAMKGKTLFAERAYNYIKMFAHSATPTETIKAINKALAEVERIINIIIETEG